MESVLFDHDRVARIGLPEAVFCESKSPEILAQLLSVYGRGSERPVLFTRLAPAVFFSLPEAIRAKVDYHELSRTAFAATLPEKRKGRVAVVSAGTADGPVTWESARTLEYLGIRHTVYEDSGVAGLWRVASRLEEINSHDAIIVVAGLDAALASVIGGLTPKPVVAVPSSVGYGMARHGEAALCSMLVSCSPGVSVMNIDNGYGAACAVARVIHLIENNECA
jgi:NCAIR mutase (PurE)-related protein